MDFKLAHLQFLAHPHLPPLAMALHCCSQLVMAIHHFDPAEAYSKSIHSQLVPLFEPRRLFAEFTPE